MGVEKTSGRAKLRRCTLILAAVRAARYPASAAEKLMTQSQTQSVSSPDSTPGSTSVPHLRNRCARVSLMQAVELPHAVR